MLQHGTKGNWKKYKNNPVLGGKYGTCFDIAVLDEGTEIAMYFSWRPRKSVAVVKSTDGIHWSEPEICIGPKASAEGWEDELNRPSVVKNGNTYYMWYTGQYKAGEADGTSHIFCAVSTDGIHFERVDDKPVLYPQEPWEKAAVMCPSVLWDEETSQYKMWYSAGEQYEPNAIGYAESPDGLVWKKFTGNPVFCADPDAEWEQHKAAGCQVLKKDEYYYMFYIGYHNEDYAQIGIARSRSGMTGWERSSYNPIIAPGEDGFDSCACYKPFAVFKDGKWLLWYNGRNGTLEQIGLVTHDGYDFAF